MVRQKIQLSELDGNNFETPILFLGWLLRPMVIMSYLLTQLYSQLLILVFQRSS